MKFFFFYIFFFLFSFGNQKIIAQTFNDTASINYESNSDSINEYNDKEIQGDETDDETSKVNDTSVLRTLSDNAWKKISDDKEFIYKKAKVREPLKVEKPIWNIAKFFSGAFFTLILCLFVGAFLIFVIYHLFFTGESKLFYRKRKDAKIEQRSFEDVEAFSEWEQALQNALNADDYRLAVRVLYLQTLQKLQQQELIQFKQDKTNWDYVNQLSSTNLHQPFITLTKYFDYIWYGSFAIDKDKYSNIAILYKNFQEVIK